MCKAREKRREKKGARIFVKGAKGARARGREGASIFQKARGREGAKGARFTTLHLIVDKNYETIT